MNTEALAEFLQTCAESGAVDLYELRQLCLAKMLEGGGEVTFIVNAGLNGKTAAQECRRDASELGPIVQRAIDMAEGKAITLTYTDMSGIGLY